MTEIPTELKKMCQDVHEMKEALLGNAIKGKLGLIHHHNQVYEDMYGINSEGKTTMESIQNCMVTRMSGVEDSQKKVIWWGGGMIAGGTAIWAAIWKLTQK
jgi:hypothetical protein